jgi:LysM repeat protein
MNFNVFKNNTKDLKQFSKKLILFFVFLFSFQTAFSQDEQVEIISHKVALGETMLMISKKYLVSPTEIYRLNKKAVDGISEGMVLYIPQPIKSQEIIAERVEKREKDKLVLQERKKEREERELAEAKVVEEKQKEVLVAENEVVDEESKDAEYRRREAISKLNISEKKQFIDHHVVSGETLNSLSKKYGVSVQEIEKENDKTLKKGLQAGQTLKMPVAQNLFIHKDPAPISENKTEVDHKVIAGETLYSISRKYGISVEDITRENEKTLKNGLQTGQVLKVKSSKAVINEEQAKEVLKPTNTDTNLAENSSSNETSIIKHHVEPKETLYSISKKYNVSVEEIKQQNEAILAKGLQTGQEIVIKLKK